MLWRWRAEGRGPGWGKFKVTELCQRGWTWWSQSFLMLHRDASLHFNVRVVQDGNVWPYKFSNSCRFSVQCKLTTWRWSKCSALEKYSYFLKIFCFFFFFLGCNLKRQHVLLPLYVERHKETLDCEVKGKYSLRIFTKSPLDLGLNIGWIVLWCKFFHHSSDCMFSWLVGGESLPKFQVFWILQKISFQECPVFIVVYLF